MDVSQSSRVWREDVQSLDWGDVVENGDEDGASKSTSIRSGACIEGKNDSDIPVGAPEQSGKMFTINDNWAAGGRHMSHMCWNKDETERVRAMGQNYAKRDRLDREYLDWWLRFGVSRSRCSHYI